MKTIVETEMYKFKLSTMVDTLMSNPMCIPNHLHYEFVNQHQNWVMGWKMNTYRAETTDQVDKISKVIK